MLRMLGLGALTLLQPQFASAVQAPDDHSVLILGSSVVGGAASIEATEAASLGFTPVVVAPAEWGATTRAEFSSFRALILGDPACLVGTASIAAAEANRSIWGPAVNGNIVIIGADPVYHIILGAPLVGPVQLIDRSIAFSAGEPSRTGAYFCLSCYYFDAPSGTPVPLLEPFGGLR